MRTNEEIQNDYMKYRGKCKEYSEKLVEEDPTLRLVRGHYFCPNWGKEMHWWCVDQDDNIIDPTAKQFPSNGTGTYVEFEGYMDCAECGKLVHEDEAHIMGNYACCSHSCAMRLVGL
jgi:hypothetical protein